MELDHLFFLTSPDAPELARLAALGLQPTYRRAHVGQGTANVCFAFSNAFLEVLWVTSADEAESPSVARMQLAGRAQWRERPACPFGIAWRPAPGSVLAAPATWACCPPYLPAGLSIDVATDSDDIRQPLMFTFPGSKAPLEWPDVRRGTLQAAAGLSRIDLHTIWLPETVTPSATLTHLAAANGATIRASATDTYAIDVALQHAMPSGDQTILRLAECQVQSSATHAS